MPKGPQISAPLAALPFAISYLLIPITWFGALMGGLWVLLPFLCTWYLFSFIDAAVGLNEKNADPNTDEVELFWYRLITMGWVPAQFISLFALLAYATRAQHLGGWELAGLFAATGVMTGTIGINYAHELMHQKPKLERWLADILLAMVLYSHFRSEHMLVHHPYVGTPRDPVTAKYNEGFHRFFPRVLRQCALSAFKAEKALLARRKAPGYDLKNPFWRYGALQLSILVLAYAIGGWVGLGLIFLQAAVAIFQLELVNYVEHYGLTREHLGEGKYEHVQPHHSWNASHKASNWLLINLQRHSDHHYKPSRRFPLLQTYDAQTAPQLPYGYPIMTMMASIPPLWRKRMNPKVRAWRRMYYPGITDWSAYNTKSTPHPR